MLGTLKRKVIGSDIEYGFRKESLKDLIEKLESNYQLLYSMAEKTGSDKSYLELLAVTFKTNVEKIYEYLDSNKKAKD